MIPRTRCPDACGLSKEPDCDGSCNKEGFDAQDIEAQVSAALAAEREELLRDSFAGGAMSALIARGERRGYYDIADWAYNQADAMMKRRKIKH